MAKKATVEAVGFSFGSVPVAPVADKSSKSSLGSFEMDGVAILSKLTAVSAVIETAIGDVEQQLKEQAKSIFVLQGAQKGSRPENFKGFEGTDEATMVFSKRSTKSVLNKDEQEILKGYDIPFDTQTVPETYAFNPKYIQDAEWRVKIEKALASIPGLPIDVITKTEASSVSTVSDASVNAIFKTREDKVETLQIANKLLPVVTTFGIKAKANVTSDFSTILRHVGDYLNLPGLKDLVSGVVANEAKPTKRK